MSQSPHLRPNLFSLAGKTALITGASSGFGHHFAGVLAAAGANVVLGARRTDKIQSRVDEINGFDGGRAIGVALDVLDADSLQGFLQAGIDEFGRLDVLVNNAGVATRAPVAAVTDEEVDFVFAVYFAI